MKLTYRLQATAAIVLVTFCLLGPRSVGATLWQDASVEPVVPAASAPDGFWARGEAGRLADAGALRAEAEEQRSTTLPMNVAIVALGSLWLALMARRIQQRSAAGRLAGGLRGGVRQPAAVGR